MNKIYLRYGDWDDGEIVWQTAVEFSPPILKKIILVERISGTDLRSINFSHTKSTRTKSYEVVISANDLLNSTKLSYLQNFLQASLCQYNLTNTDWATNAVYVTFDKSEELPFESIADHKLLSKISLKLIQKYPD